MRRRNWNKSAKSRFIASKDLPSSDDYRIEQNRDEIEMAITRHIAEEFEFSEESRRKKKSCMEKSKSTEERNAGAGRRAPCLYNILCNYCMSVSFLHSSSSSLRPQRRRSPIGLKFLIIYQQKKVRKMFFFLISKFAF